jgi:hypothetical protein
MIAHGFCSSACRRAPLTSVQIIRQPCGHDRAFSDTFTGIAPGSAPGFSADQILGAMLRRGVVAVLNPQVACVADEVVVPHPNTKPTVDQWNSS